MNTSHRRPLLKALLFVSLFSLTCKAQDLDQGLVTGRVSDPNGHSVNGAAVTLTDSAGLRRRTSTDARGMYSLPELPLGAYSLTVRADGFAAVETSRFALAVGASLIFDFALQPTPISATETVTIDADDAMKIDNSRTTVSTSFSKAELQSIPNPHHDPLGIILFLSGVSEEALSVRDLADQDSPSYRVTPVEQGLASVSGGTSFSNNVTIDGLDNNDDFTARERFTPPLDAVAEVQVVKNQFSAEYGRAAGSRINLVTESGGPRLRGAATASFRHDRLNANSWRNNSRGIPRPKMRHRRFSGTLGGPVTVPRGGGRLSFLAAYHIDVRGDDTLIDTFVPEGRNPNFALTRGNGRNLYCDHEDESRCLATPMAAGWMRGFVSRLDTPERGQSFLGRMDHRTDRGIDTTIGVQIGRRNNPTSTSPRLTRLPEALQSRSTRSHAVNFTNSHRFRQRFFNQLRLQTSSLEPAFASPGIGGAVIVIGYRNPLTGTAENLTASNSTSGTLQNFSEARSERRVQITDSLTYAGGRHTLRTGFEIQRVSSRSDSLEDSSGTFNFPSVASFQSNTLSRFRQSFGTAAGVRNVYTGFFVNGEFRPHQNLGVSLGLRHESETALRDRDNFGPRMGVVWNPRGSSNSVLRFGMGGFFNRVLIRTLADHRRSLSGYLTRFDSNLIGSSTSDIRRSRVLAAIAERFPSGFGSVSALQALLSTVDCSTAGAPFLPCPTTTGFASSSLPDRVLSNDIRVPESLQLNAGYEARLGRSLVLEVNATLNGTSGLWRERSLNPPRLPAGYADWTSYLLANPFVFTNSNGTVRTYVFHLGNAVTAASAATSPGGSSPCPTTVTVTCHVNLNYIGSSTTAPSTTGPDSSNSIGTALGIAAAAIDHLRDEPGHGHREEIFPGGSSRYRGLTFEVRWPTTRLPFSISSMGRLQYTLSKTEDDGLNNTSNAESDGDFGREWARSLSDRRHRISFTGVFETPSALGRVTFSPALRFGSSAPFNIGIGVDRNLDGSATDRPVFHGDIRRLRWRRPDSPSAEDLLGAFMLQPIGARGGTLPRNAGHGPASVLFDLALSRKFRAGRRTSLLPRLEIGNVLNMTVFSYGAEYVDFAAIGPNPTDSQMNARRNFLVPSRTLRPRETRASLRIEF